MSFGFVAKGSSACNFFGIFSGLNRRSGRSIFCAFVSLKTHARFISHQLKQTQAY
jgi:hypothetical protein